MLDLLSEAAEELPLLCIIDDQHWLDFASALVLSFIARRSGSESLGLVFATNASDQHLTGLPEHHVEGLPVAEAATLLDSSCPPNSIPGFDDWAQHNGRYVPDCG